MKKKHTHSEMKNSLGGIKSRIDTTKEMINELEGTTTEKRKSTSTEKRKAEKKN